MTLLQTVRRLLFGFPCAVAYEEVFEFFFELADVFEVAVYRCEADVGDGVEAFEVLHNQLADFRGGTFAFRGVHEIGLSGVDNLFQLSRGDGAFFAGAEEAAEDLLAVEAFPAAVFFNDHVRDFVDALVGGAAAIALLALAATANGISFLAFARVDDAILKKSAVGALHA